VTLTDQVPEGVGEYSNHREESVYFRDPTKYLLSRVPAVSCCCAPRPPSHDPCRTLQQYASRTCAASARSYQRSEGFALNLLRTPPLSPSPFNLPPPPLSLSLSLSLSFYSHEAAAWFIHQRKKKKRLRFSSRRKVRKQIV